MRVRGRENVEKVHLMQVAARNVGLIMRALFGIGTPRSLQGAMGGLEWALSSLSATTERARWRVLAALGVVSVQISRLRRGERVELEGRGCHAMAA